MQFETQIDTGRVKSVENRAPAIRQFIERRLNRPRRTLRPRIDVWPSQRSGKRHMRVEPEISRSLSYKKHLLNAPRLPGRRIAAYRFGGETIEGLVVRGMNRHQMSLEVRCQFRQLHMIRGENAMDLVAVASAFRGALQVEQTAVPGRNLYTLVAERGSPGGNLLEIVEWGHVAGKLRKKDGGTFNGFHGIKIFR